VQLLEKYTHAPLAQKSLVCPNAFEFPGAIRKPAKAAGLILTASEDLPLTHSYNPVMEAVAQFSSRHGLPVYYFGKKAEKVHTRLKHLTHLGLVPYWQYHALLAALPPMIGLAPLETVADQGTLDFINGKSDIKMLEFGGHGHPAVYSKAPPFVDTDLKAGVLVDNTVESWREGLESVYGSLWRRLAQEQRQVIELRNMDRVAAERWYPALLAARLPRPLTGREINYPGGKLNYYRKAFRHLVYSQDHLFLKKLQEQVPPFLLKIVKKIY